MSLFQLVQSLTGNPLLDRLMVVFAEYLVLLIPLALVYLWFIDDEGRYDAIFAFTAVVLGLAISYILGLFESHPAPYQSFETILSEAPENSFPSQHTAVIFSMVWPLIYRVRKKLSALLLVAASLTAFGRVYTGLHFPVDVAGGILASLIGFGTAYLGREYIEKFAELCIRIEEKCYEIIGWNLRDFLDGLKKKF